MKSNITITQIAQESGVSVATVSRFLNGKVPVSADKKARIEAVVKKYDFTPNALARGLISKRTMTLGVILPDITNPYFATIFQEVQRCAAEEGYSVYLCNTRFHHGDSPIDETGYFRMMMDKKVDGILIIGGQLDMVEPNPAYKEALNKLAASIPVVAAGRAIPGVDCIFLDSENGSGVVTAYNYLASLGHKHIAFAGGQPGVTITETRLEAYKKAAASSGSAVQEDLISLSDYYLPDGYQAAEALLTRETPFTAVIAMNDNVALGAIRAFADHGLSVPRDVALISCDRFYFADYTMPRLTSIHHHSRRWGQMVVRTLIQSIQGSTENDRITFPPELIIGESCGTHLHH